MQERVYAVSLAARGLTPVTATRGVGLTVLALITVTGIPYYPRYVFLFWEMGNTPTGHGKRETGTIAYHVALCSSITHPRACCFPPLTSHLQPRPLSHVPGARTWGRGPRESSETQVVQTRGIVVPSRFRVYMYMWLRR